MPQSKHKKTNASSQTLWVRTVALICAVLIAGSVLSIVFYL